MESAKNTIKSNNLLKKGDTVAVAVSGGIDSICLLHYLNSIKKELGIKLVAVNVDHQIRPNSASDSQFVIDYCKSIDVPCYKFNIDVPQIALQKKMGLEETARICRYKVFDGVVDKGLANKVALAHHQSDQVETVLLNIFRGAGLKGAGGMEAEQGHYIRPFLNTKKDEIIAYANQFNLNHVEDETNADTNYSRNFLRNDILPKLRTRWKNIDANILNFAKICKQDNEYILSQINFDDIVIENKTARIPLYKFASPDSIQNRILLTCFQKLGLAKDIEKRHLAIIKNLAQTGQNGAKISLPNKIKASLEYDELVLCVPKQKVEFVPKDFKLGKTIFDNYIATVKKTSKFNVLEPNCHILDVKKLPKDVKWRTRQNGDVFAKFGCGEKKLKDYFIDIKVPNSIRGEIPLLASKNEVYCVLGYQISDKVKADDNTKWVYKISYQKNNQNQ
jgi:tRNA(Ile)-lysidine synthase